MNIEKLYSKKEIINSIQNVLTKDLLDKKHQHLTESHKFGGHCYAASEAFFYFFGGKDEWTPMMGRDEEGISHWWLKNKHTEEIVDITKEQYTDLNKNPPYDNGKGRGFQKQSLRSIEIMERVSDELFLKNKEKGKELKKILNKHLKALNYKNKKVSP